MKYIVEAYDEEGGRWYVSAVHTLKQKAQYVVKELKALKIKARIKEE